MSQVQDAKNAMSAMQKVNDTQKKLGLDVVGRPPMCHVAINILASLFFPVLAHFLARPDDIKSLSFVGVLLGQIAAYVLSFIPIISYVGSAVYICAVFYTIFVCLMSEKRQPYAASKTSSSGVVDLER